VKKVEGEERKQCEILRKEEEKKSEGKMKKEKIKNCLLMTFQNL
jgi:hypothetical protein